MSGSERGYHLTVFENIFAAPEPPLGVVRSHGSRSSPLPQLTGDVGRSCGDASCALLFIDFIEIFSPVEPV
jgi:hypothetical protein